MTDGTGKLFLKGRNTSPNATSGATTIGVILNGFEINEVPEPGTFGLAMVAIPLFCLRRRL
jgi:hypothetical protein